MQCTSKYIQLNQVTGRYSILRYFSKEVLFKFLHLSNSRVVEMNRAEDARSPVFLVCWFFWNIFVFDLLYHYQRTRIEILYIKQHVLIQNRLSFSFAMGPRSLGPKHKLT